MFLNQTAATTAGTDEMVDLRNLKRSLILFISGIFNAECGDILLSPVNAPKLEPVLTTIVTYSTEYPDVVTQKLAIGLFSTLITSWATNPQIPPPTATSGPIKQQLTKKQQQNNITAVGTMKKEIPEFVSGFVYGRIVPVLFSVLVGLQGGWEKDAQTNQVVTEMATCLRSLVSARGAEEVLSWMRGWLGSNLEGVMEEGRRAVGSSKKGGGLDADSVAEGLVRAIVEGKKNTVVTLKQFYKMIV
ncbi:pre-tRNA nuclear export protein [Nowakowskiella sp. JEL0407]|nr:pre-tRNA nuclear export protein [Nowakowskiella sp. JEL0407]